MSSADSFASLSEAMYGGVLAEEARRETAGYHLTPIPRGKFGELTKVVEEIHEVIDAESQGNPVMVLVELSDVLAAINGFLKKHHPSIKLEDLAKMAQATDRAFKSGERNER